MILKFQGFDSFVRPVYKDENSKLWKDTDPRVDHIPKLASAYQNLFEGEPDVSLKTDKEIEFIPCRIVWGYKKYTKSHLVSYLLQFIKDRKPLGNFVDNFTEWEQIRAMFTTICLMDNIDKDSSEFELFSKFVFEWAEIDDYDAFRCFITKYL